MPATCVRVARGLLLYGQQIQDGALSRSTFLSKLGVPPNTFRSAGYDLGATANRPGLRFFDSSKKDKIAFGPGAGLVLGVSLGTASLRAALVDANGWTYHAHESEPQSDQLSARPEELVARVGEAARNVLRAARDDRTLLVEGELPFLGLSIAWPTPMDHHKKPIGPALGHSAWRFGSTLTQRVATGLGLPPERSHALNDAQAAAIAIAYDHSRVADHVKQVHARVAIVVRLSAAVGAATILIEPPDSGNHDKAQHGATSGFVRSALIGGRDGHAGELGHVLVDPGDIAALNATPTRGLGSLVATPCSCTEPGGALVDHLEAYTAAAAVAHRVAPGAQVGAVIRGIRRAPDTEPHRRALEDVGVLLGKALAGPVAMLNPTTITLSGSLAVPVVGHSLNTYLAEVHVFGTPPELRLLTGKDNTFVRARGAALAVVRQAVHRRLTALLAGPKGDVITGLQKLVIEVPNGMR